MSSPSDGRTVPSRQSRTVQMNTDLTDQQIEDLAMIVFEENGACLTSDELDEQIHLHWWLL